MDVTSLAIMARQHWALWLPRKTQELEEMALLSQALQIAAIYAHREIAELVLRGYQAHEAAEVVLPKYILMAPEASVTCLQDTKNLEVGSVGLGRHKGLLLVSALPH